MPLDDGCYDLGGCMRYSVEWLLYKLGRMMFRDEILNSTREPGLQEDWNQGTHIICTSIRSVLHLLAYYLFC